MNQSFSHQKSPLQHPCRGLSFSHQIIHCLKFILNCLMSNCEIRCHLTRREIVQCREIADSREFVTADTVKNTLRKVEEYFKRHAREVRFLLREL